MTVKFMTEEDIVKSVSTIENTAGRLQDRIHRTAVSILKLMHDKKIDALRASDLMTSVQHASPYHQNSFSKWVQAVTPFTWSKEDAKNKRWIAHKNAVITGKEFMYARDTPFFKLAPPAVPQPYDFIQVLNREISKAEKRVEGKTKGTDEDNIPGPLLRSIKDLLSNVKEEAVDH